jgi:DNA replication protein DnaC
MLLEQTMEKLNSMKLYGMVEALRQWLDKPKEKDIAPVDLIGVIADAEWIHRENLKLTARLRNARFRQPACVEDIDYAHARGLSKAVVLELATSRWAASHQNIILTGPTGVGKSYLACALGNKACRDGFTVAYRRTSRLFDELAQARADGTYPHLLRRLAKMQVLILDDFGLEILGAPQRKELLEILDDRHGVSSTVITSQLDPKDWHAVIGDPTIADAVCDRVVHNSHRLKLAGDSIRKAGSGLTNGKKTAK